MTKTFPLIISFIFSGFITFSQNGISISALRFIGEKIVDHNAPFKGTTIGGLSGIDYNSDEKIFYLLSDDRSVINPARFYTAKIDFSSTNINSIDFLEVYTLHQKNGMPYPSIKTDPALTPDPESIRYNAKTKQLFWSSEGERMLREKGNVLADPSITIATKEGNLISSFLLPEHLKILATEKGPRQNGTLEGITFSTDFNLLYAALEEPLYEDGPRAEVEATKSLVRIYKFDLTGKKNNAQYAYPLESVAYPPLVSGLFIVNGISEIVFIGQNKLLTVERSFSTGRLPCTIKIFITDLTNADNVMKIKSLKESTAKMVEKKLLLNMDDLGIYIDNIEGVTFGPELPNGHKTLIFVSDNNFLSIEKTQFLLFEVIP